ncbi:MAG: hypothetical protein ACI8Z1_001442 [Candidatus Azotimanducaceae bacterium]|jgi:hypothetical protein
MAFLAYKHLEGASTNVERDPVYSSQTLSQKHTITPQENPTQHVIEAERLKWYFETQSKHDVASQIQ